MGKPHMSWLIKKAFCVCRAKEYCNWIEIGCLQSEKSSFELLCSENMPSPNFCGYCASGKKNVDTHSSFPCFKSRKILSQSWPKKSAQRLWKWGKDQHAGPLSFVSACWTQHVLSPKINKGGNEFFIPFSLSESAIYCGHVCAKEKRTKKTRHGISGDMSTWPRFPYYRKTKMKKHDAHVSFPGKLIYLALLARFPAHTEQSTKNFSDENPLSRFWVNPGSGNSDGKVMANFPDSDFPKRQKTAK